MVLRQVIGLLKKNQTVTDVLRQAAAPSKKHNKWLKNQTRNAIKQQIVRYLTWLDPLEEDFF